ncbi:phage holliday junction resolvase [Proteus mirabilis]|uniref:Phage holliday junction resolvase n=1 Tax=Proteus mirabilis TaxID=584 RepID=A0A379FII0_PROMI|nr:phage holliday junction resolvase [Proteus mirabilis]
MEKRPPVLKYFAFKDEVKLNKITLPESTLPHYIHSTHAEELE